MRATLIGATGLIGGHLLEQLLSDRHFEKVNVLLRRPFDKAHPKLEKRLVDFSDPESLRLALEDSDVIFCTVGTTHKKVKGDKTAYRKVDFDIPVHAARLGKQNGCERFIVVSSVGANAKSRNFYLRLKGEMEEAVKAVGLRHLHILQPSILLGKRKENRPGEKVGQFIMQVYSFLLPKKYKPVQASKVAAQMIEAAKTSI